MNAQVQSTRVLDQISQLVTVTGNFVTNNASNKRRNDQINPLSQGLADMLILHVQNPRSFSQQRFYRLTNLVTKIEAWHRSTSLCVHQGFEGNENIDDLAKKGTETLSLIGPMIDLPKSYLIQQVTRWDNQ